MVWVIAVIVFPVCCETFPQHSLQIVDVLISKALVANMVIFEAQQRSYLVVMGLKPSRRQIMSVICIASCYKSGHRWALLWGIFARMSDISSHHHGVLQNSDIGDSMVGASQFDIDLQPTKLISREHPHCGNVFGLTRDCPLVAH
jgi:hypothetical protein